jgi:hypothetical protein
LEKEINKDIGLELDILNLATALKIGITVEYFSLDGKSPNSRDLLKMYFRGELIKEALHLRILIEISSYPLEILPLPSQYILSLLMFMIRNRIQFLVNSEIHHIITTQRANFHQPSVNVAKYQKGVYYLGVKVFNALPSDIKQSLIILRNLKWFYKIFM